MINSFVTAIRETLGNELNFATTENGALGYRTTGKELLDLNFSVASLREANPADIVKRFSKAFFEDKITAMKWLFFARDIRDSGLGERRLFRVIIEHLATENPEYIAPLLGMIPEYGRFDDLWCLLDTKLADNVISIVVKQLAQDTSDMLDGKSISLLAKWLPSANASSATTKHYAKKLYRKMGISEKEYRIGLSALRRYLDVVECKMSDKSWSEIDYAAVPSRANLLYNKAFLRNDEERRREFLESLSKGETKINAGTLFPHDIVHKYTSGSWHSVNEFDATLEELWRALPDAVDSFDNTIVVADGSGSMTTRIGDSVTALDVANALAIYFAERSSGAFKDQYITFSERPQLVNLGNGKGLREKLQIALSYNEVANTNIEAVFDLILTTAVREHMRQEDLPNNILIISDMEFDSCVTSGESRDKPDSRLFSVIQKRYEEAGYRIPRLVFWNVNSRTGTIPVTENDLGVALVSGFSTNIAKMVMSNQTEPYECLLEILNSERYSPIGVALGSINNN